MLESSIILENEVLVKIPRRKRLCKCGKRLRRPGQKDCLICHRISVQTSRVRNKVDLKTKFAVMETIVAKLAGGHEQQDQDPKSPGVTL